MLSMLICVSLQAQNGSRPPVICIDPGHPSESGRGTRGKQSTEIEVAWEIGRLLEKRLVREGFKVVLTKSSGNRYVTNKQRAEIANKHRTDLMLRLHCDASSRSGASVYYPGRQGRSGNFVGPPLEVLSRSKTVAEEFQAAFRTALKGKLDVAPLQTDQATRIGAKQGALTGSIFAKVPVILVELCVLTNRKDEQFILSKAGREAMVNALLSGVKAVFRQARFMSRAMRFMSKILMKTTARCPCHEGSKVESSGISYPRR